MIIRKNVLGKTTNNKRYNRGEFLMIDIRKACKVFLDFVYKEEMLPNKIIKIIDNNYSQDLPQNAIKWDIREIFNLFFYRENYRANKNKSATSAILQEIERNAHLFSANECDQDIKRWMFNNNRQFLAAKDFCNDFFHNVSNDDGVELFFNTLKSIIQNSKTENAEIFVEQLEKTRTSSNKEKKDEPPLKHIVFDQITNSLKKSNTDVRWPFKRNRSGAINFCQSKGHKILGEICFASVKRNLHKNHEVFWGNPDYNLFLNSDWTFIFNNQLKKCLHLVFIPKGKFTPNLEKAHRKGDEFDLNVDTNTFVDIDTQFDFKDFGIINIPYNAEDLAKYDIK